MTNPMTLYRIAQLIGVLLLCVTAFWCIRLRPENLNRFEKWPRNRLFGLLLGWVALALCVSHARVVAPDFLLPFLWPLALGVPVLSYFFLDYCLARAVGGTMILWAYYWIYFAFAFHSPVMVVIAPAAWIFGGAGIWISGKPWALRDWIRKCAISAKWRSISVALLLGVALTMVVSSIWG